MIIKLPWLNSSTGSCHALNYKRNIGSAELDLMIIIPTTNQSLAVAIARFLKKILDTISSHEQYCLHFHFKSSTTYHFVVIQSIEEKNVVLEESIDKCGNN